MARRSRDWNIGLAEDLRKPQFAREFLMAAADEGVPLPWRGRLRNASVPG